MEGSGAVALALVALWLADGLKVCPLTVSPPSESLPAEVGAIPLTRAIRSSQFLNGPCLRASMMRVAVAGPMPLTSVSSADVALLASTAANASAV